MNEYYSKFVDFCKRYGLYDEKIFNYLRRNSFMFDFRDDDYRSSIGARLIYNNGKVDMVNLVVPYIDDDDVTVLINIHEYTHGVIYYKKLGKEYDSDKDINREILPMLYEKLYMLENMDNTSLVEYENYLNGIVINSDDEVYKLGLACRDHIIDRYSNGFNFNRLHKITGMVSRKVRVLGRIEQFKSYLR